MDAERLDDLSRILLSASSRRGVLARLVSGLLATLSLALGGDNAGAKNKKRKRKKKGNAARLLTSPPPPGPVTRVDATCPFGSPFYGLGTADGNGRLAQTFTALASGPLVRADLDINKQTGSLGDYVLRLSPLDGAGKPTDDVLASAAVPDPSVPFLGAIVTFTFSNPFSVAAGNQYALVLTRPGGPEGIIWSGHKGNTCPGHAFWSESDSAEFEEPDATVDLHFTTYVTS